MNKQTIPKLYQSLMTLLIFLLFFSFCQCGFNTSICGYIQQDQLYFFVNSAKSDNNLISLSSTSITTYNLCHQLQYWCGPQNTVITGSLIIQTQQGHCIPYKQSYIEYINGSNITHGLRVVYSIMQMNQSMYNASIRTVEFQYQCNENVTIGCPEVAKTTLWTYFAKNSIGYTIAIQVIGVLFMLLGVYMYRVTIVILGWATAFIILLTIQQTVVFKPGVPQAVLSNVLLLTIICGFFVGYVLAYFPKAGLFCMGMWIGLIISLTLNNVCLYLIYSDPDNLPLFIMLPVLCVGFGILTMCVKRKFIVFATSLIGAYICLRALSWHLGAFPNEFLYPKQYHLGLIGVVKWQFYLYVVALLILTASSSALQFWLFKKKASKNKQSEDIDQHFQNMQNKMENQRGNLMEFENIFKKLKDQHRMPRVLRKNNQSGSENDDPEQNSRRLSQDFDENLQMSQQQQQEYDRKNKKNNKNKKKQQSEDEQELEQKLITKGNKKRK